MTKKASKVLNIVLNICLVIALILTTYFVFFSFTHFSSNVQGYSMRPTFNNTAGEEDRVLASKIAHYTYGDVVILKVEAEGGEESKDIIKRIYAFGGDSVDMVFADHHLNIIVNGEVVQENQYSEPIYYENEPNTYLHFCVLKNSWQGEGGGADAIVLPSDTVFVLGDNRQDSSDSASHGAYETSCIKAKVLTIIPKNSFAPFELIKYYL